MGVKAYISNGVTFLNGKYPGWAHEINLADFDMGDPSRCVIGQLEGDYEVVETMALMVDGILRAPNECGFDVIVDDFDDLAISYAELTQAWRREIKAQRKER
jgi:hypothetical protein